MEIIPAERKEAVDVVFTPQARKSPSNLTSALSSLAHTQCIPVGQVLCTPVRWK